MTDRRLEVQVFDDKEAKKLLADILKLKQESYLRNKEQIDDSLLSEEVQI